MRRRSKAMPGSAATLRGRRPALLPLALCAGCGSPGAAGRSGEERHHGGRELPVSADARERGQAPRAQGAGRRRTRGEGGGEGEKAGSRSPGRTAHLPILGPPAGGFLPEPRSFFLPFPLALPSLRSDISLEKCTLYADGSGRRQHAASLVPGLGSGLRSFSLEGESDPAAALSQRRGVSCCLQGAARTRRAVQATWD